MKNDNLRPAFPHIHLQETNTKKKTPKRKDPLVVQIENRKPAPHPPKPKCYPSFQGGNIFTVSDLSLIKDLFSFREIRMK